MNAKDKIDIIYNLKSEIDEIYFSEEDRLELIRPLMDYMAKFKIHSVTFIYESPNNDDGDPCAASLHECLHEVEGVAQGQSQSHKVDYIDSFERDLKEFKTSKKNKELYTLDGAEKLWLETHESLLLLANTKKLESGFAYQYTLIDGKLTEHIDHYYAY